MCSSFYLGALLRRPKSLMGRGTRQTRSPATRELRAKGAPPDGDGTLFNGEYFDQKFMAQGLRASPSDRT